MGKRRVAREIALKALYQIDVRGLSNLDFLDGFWEANRCDAESREFAELLIRGAFKCMEKIDHLIKESAENWSLERMAVVDRNILRIAIFELLFMDEIPPKVTINEAIDIAKEYSTEDSGKFINGILDRIMKKEESTS